MNMRQAKGQELARRGKIRFEDNRWVVPSQSGNGAYTVTIDTLPPYCNCPDYELRAVKCKHIYAVEYVVEQETLERTRHEREMVYTEQTEQGLVTTKVTETTETTTKTTKRVRVYREQDWPAYNAAQTQEKTLFQQFLHTLCETIPEPQQHMGRPRHSLRDMVYAAAFKVYSTISARRFATDLLDAKAKGHLSRAPHHSSVFRIFENPDLIPILRAMIERASLPLKAVETVFAVDASGFTTCNYVRWYDAKYGQETDMRDWLKVHIMCGVNTNIVTSVEITNRDGADYNQFRPLVQATARHFQLEEISADKAFLSRKHLQLVVDLGATPYIPFKSNSKGRMSSMATWDQMYHFYMLHRETFLEHYHRRSNVESTFSMIKAKFGASIRSKTTVAQVNELLCKILCHNLCVVIQSMFELGIEPKF